MDTCFMPTPVFKSVILKCWVEICTLSKDMFKYVHFVEMFLDMCKDGFRYVVENYKSFLNL